jgi:N-acetylmuramoyl-L-alanine amidase
VISNKPLQLTVTAAETHVSPCLLPTSKLRKSRNLPCMSRSRLALVFLGLTVWLLTCAISVAASFSTVVIDAGHGGFDRGGIRANIIPEKGVALDVARRLRTYLADAGLRTIMTRSQDTFVTLDRRVAIANGQRRAIFVSIHFNSAPRRGADGIETFYGSPRAKKLASLIQRYAMKTTSGENRGIKRARFYVLRRSRIPAVLIECGFLTNPQDARRASRPAWRDQLARQIARAIIEYRRS